MRQWCGLSDQHLYMNQSSYSQWLSLYLMSLCTWQLHFDDDLSIDESWKKRSWQEMGQQASARRKWQTSYVTVQASKAILILTEALIAGLPWFWIYMHGVSSPKSKIAVIWGFSEDFHIWDNSLGGPSELGPCLGFERSLAFSHHPDSTVSPVRS